MVVGHNPIQCSSYNCGNYGHLMYDCRVRPWCWCKIPYHTRLESLDIPQHNVGTGRPNGQDAPKQLAEAKDALKETWRAGKAYKN